MSDDEAEFAFTNEMLFEFMDECIEEIGRMENLLFEFESNPNNAQAIDGVFRVAHSIKGSAAFFKLNASQKLAHSLENVLGLLRSLSLSPAPHVISTILAGFFELDVMCKRVKEGEEEVNDLEKLENLHHDLEQLTHQRRDLQVEMVLYLNTINAFISTFEPKEKESSAFKIIQQETDRISSLVASSKPKNNFRKTRSYVFQEQDVSGEMSTINDILKLKTLKTLSPDTAQRLSDALSILTQTLKDEALAIGKNMLASMGLVLAEVKDFDEELLQELHKELDELLSYIDQSDIKETSVKQEDRAISKENEDQKQTGKTMRVSEEKVDGFMHFVGELVVISDMLNYIEAEITKADSSSELSLRFKQANQNFNNLSQKLRESLLEIRRVPVSNILRKVPALARSTADKVGKQVNIEIIGDETQIDKSLFEVLDHPITHIIRNAVDHGIETPEERKRVHKPEKGTITINMSQADDWITLSIKDDGGGIKLKKVLQKAIEKRLITDIAASQLSEEESLNLLFMPGFSTVDQVSDISGRGVGLDVAKSNIESVNGKIQIKNNPGEGTEFIIRLPTSTSFVVVDGVNGVVGKNEYVFPVDSVNTIFRPSKSDLLQVDSCEMVNFAGEIIPILKLFQVFHISTKFQSPEDAILVIIEYRNKKLAVLIDKILGRTQVVIRDLGIQLFEKHAVHKGIAGGAIMGHGEVALVLEIKELMDLI